MLFHPGSTVLLEKSGGGRFIDYQLSVGVQLLNVLERI
jgi:hypothetical protein